MQIQNSCIKASFPEELLGIKIDSILTFHENITSLCLKANKKLSTLSRVLAIFSKLLYFLTIL